MAGRGADSPLGDLLGVTGLTDYEIRRLLRDTAEEAERIVRSAAGKGRGAQIRSAQVQLANQAAQMWGGVGDAVRVGVGDAVDASAQWGARYDFDLMRAAGLSGTHWQQSVVAQARSGIDSLLARQGNKRSLSQTVYRNSKVHVSKVEDLVNQGLLLGKSAKEIAASVKGFIDPATPGGASYAAMRLGRTEINNAFHETAKNKYIDTPWIERVQWNLSGSHTRPDTCNTYADTVNHDGLDAGVFLPGEVPDKPHPNCFCFITPEVMDLDEYAKRFNAGEYDNYINKQMGCARG